MLNLEDFIRSIPNFPKPGIEFKDLTPLLANPEAVNQCTYKLLEELKGLKIDKVVGIESRGFFFATLLAQRLDAGFVPIRKLGKLPYKALQETYSLEYGEDIIEIHEDAISTGELVLLHDDVLATGGTAKAGVNLIEQLGGTIVQCNFLIELNSLNGREQLANYNIHSLFNY